MKRQCFENINDAIFTESELAKLVSLGQQLAGECKEHLSSECSCHESYTGRNKTDPSCEYCNIGKHILPIVVKIIGL